MSLHAPMEYDEKRREKNQKELVNAVSNELTKYEGRFPEVSATTGVSREFISLLNRGRVINPTLEKLTKVMEFLGYRIILVRREDYPFED